MKSVVESSSPKARQKAVTFSAPDDLMVAAESLSDVMVEACERQTPVVGNLAHDLGAERILVPEFTAREAADVAHCPERVLVDREDVVEVVLHLSHDVPEGRQEASEHAPRVHELERVVGSLGHPEDVEEGRLIDQIVPEGVVDRRGGVPECAQQAR